MFRSMEQGINAVRAGNLEEGARLLRIELKNPELTGQLRAVALMWLAETGGEVAFKVDCYREGLAADPGNVEANQRLAYFLAMQLPQERPPVMPAPPQPQPYAPPPAPGYAPPPAYGPVYGQTPVPAQTVQPAQPTAGAPYESGASFRTVGVLDGPNGPGTGFFMRQDGLLATTRYVVGGLEQVTIALETGRRIPGRVVRGFPDFDLALIRAEITVSSLLTLSPLPHVPEETRLTAIAFGGQVVPGQRRSTKRQLPAQWFPTTIRALADAGGNPVFDERNYVLGMLTKNFSRSSGYVYGLHIAAIVRCVDAYAQEALEGSRAYCPSCGHASRAPNFRAFYCEVCGSTLPVAQQAARFPMQQAATLYAENMHQPCRHCGARVGYYEDKCLRCGGAISGR